MELDERKEKILKAIIQTYLETGEPVGSRTISKYSGLKLSSATIRNEMSDLEELGYIIQPHTSAGRIPSDKGYRFYVDQIIEEKDSQVNAMLPPPAQCSARMFPARVPQSSSLLLPQTALQSRWRKRAATTVTTMSCWQS